MESGLQKRRLKLKNKKMSMAILPCSFFYKRLIVRGDFKDEVIALAKEDEKIKEFINGKQIKKEIYVPGKLVNIVAI